MIRFLSIRDLAIVDRLDVEFDEGFNVLTGETGAGKSIIVGALELLVGERSSSDLVRTGCDKSVVQATFESAAGTEIIVRREISARGRSRTFVDDALVPVSTLRDLGVDLLDIHGQHEHQALLDPDAHERLLDAYAGLGDEAAALGTLYQGWRRLQARVDQATASAAERGERVDFVRFQLDEIDRVSPATGEDERLGAEQKRLANAERLATLSQEVYAALYERDESVMSLLGGMWRQLDEIESLDPAFDSARDVRDGVTANLDDLAQALRSYAASIEIAPERLAEVESRLADIERLKRKHGGSLAAVLERRADLVAELDTLDGGDGDPAALAREAAVARERYHDAAEALSRRRHRDAKRLSAAVEDELRALAIDQSRFEVRLDSPTPETSWGPTGFDRVEFFFSANPGEEPRALTRIASGGELSRVMLALKTLASTDVVGKTLVFDEVDAGVGGQAADSVGERLRRLGDRYQVLCVTHAPQLAAHASTHFAVDKQLAAGRTTTRVDRLGSEEGRAGELARLMTGKATDAALASAVDLLRSKQKAKGERRKRKGENSSPAQQHG